MPGYRRTPPATDTADPGPAGLPEGSGAAGLCRPFSEVIAAVLSHRTPPRATAPSLGQRGGCEKTEYRERKKRENAFIPQRAPHSPRRAGLPLMAEGGRPR